MKLSYNVTGSFVSNDISLSKSLAMARIILPDMLVEQFWQEALPGEFQIFAFKGSASSAVYPHQHLIFNALNTTPSHSVKAVILGQVYGF